MFSVDTNTFSIPVDKYVFKKSRTDLASSRTGFRAFRGTKTSSGLSLAYAQSHALSVDDLRRPRAWPAHIRKPQRPGNSVQPPAGQKPRKHALLSLRCRYAAFGLFGARASATLASRWTSVYLTVRLVPGNGRRLHANRYLQCH